MVKVAERQVAGVEPRDLSAYTYAQASRLLDIPASTIRAWKKGQDYNVASGARKRFEQPLPSPKSTGLSYNDLVEVYVLRSLRTEHGYPLEYIRQALAMARDEFGIDRLFLHKTFRHGGQEFFLDRLDDFAALSRTRQLAFREVLKGYLHRIQYDREGWAREFSPFGQVSGVASPHLVILNPRISFGRPVVKRRGIRTAAIAVRVDAGESPEHIIADFDLTREEFDEAILVEAA
jgi:uncharacterized protein (DUF433 family)/DNA-binding transcriptional MerR regulator